MQVSVKFFAILREMTGVKSEVAEIAQGTTVEALWKQYAARNPRVGSIRAAYAVNQKLAKPDQLLSDGDEVGFLPPVSGGATARKKKRATTRRQASSPESITRRPLNLAALVRSVEFPGAGAIVTFSGVVRNHSRGKSVDHLEYEAYPEMADATLSDILAEIKERWPDVRAAMAHRVGRLKIGDASLLIAVAAPHRSEAYAASRYAIERVKAVLPVWKKEFASDGEYWVEGPVAGEAPPENTEAIVREAEYTPF